MAPSKLKIMVRFRLSDILKEKGMTQGEVAEKAGLSRTAIGVLARSPARVSMDTLAKLSSALGVRVMDLFEVVKD